MAAYIAELAPKTKLGNYRIEKVIAKGGFGITYLGRFKSTNELVVIKENIPGKDAQRAPGKKQFIPGPVGDASVRGSAAWAETNFKREADNLMKLQHPNVVPIKEVFDSKETNTCYYVMPYVCAVSLQGLVNRKFEPTSEWLHYMLCTLLQTLQYVHNRELLHRDIKPDNILIREDGSPVLIDFGSARCAEADVHTAIASAGYSPQEQLKGAGEGRWTDLYALGATLYCVITGTPPPDAYARMGENDPYVPLTKNERLVEKYGFKLLAGIDCAMRLNVGKRFHSALEWLRYMENVPGFQATTPVVVPLILAELAYRAGADGSRVKVPGRGGDSILLSSEAIMIRNDEKKRHVWVYWLLGLILLCVIALVLWWLLTKKEELRPEIPLEQITEPPPPPPVSELAPELAPEVRLLARPEVKMLNADGSVKKTDDGKDAYIRPFGVYYASSEEKGGRYAVYDTLQDYRRQGAPCGYLNKADVYVWPYNLAMQYGLGARSESNRVIYFDTPEQAKQYAANQLDIRKNACAYADSILTGVNNTEAASVVEQAGVCAIEAPEMLRSNSYMLPVLDFIKPSKSARNAPALAKIAAATPVYKQMEQIRSTQHSEFKGGTINIQPVEICFVADTTASMKPYMDAMKAYIADTAVSMESFYVRSVIEACCHSVQSGGAGELLRTTAEAREKVFVKLPGYKPVCLNDIVEDPDSVTVMPDNSGECFVRFGLVAYRDWMYKKTPSEEKKLLFDEQSVQLGFGHGGDAVEKDNRYLVHNFNKASGRMMPAHEFLLSALSSDAFCEASEDSIDFCEDVQAGLKETLNMPWSPDSVRLVVLMGDAPGREVGEVESDALRMTGSKKIWNRRACGSSIGMSSARLISELKTRRISLLSWWFEPIPLWNGKYKKFDPVEQNGEMVDPWQQFVEKSQAQFRMYAESVNGGDSAASRADFIPIPTEYRENIADKTAASAVQETMAQEFKNRLGTEISKVVREELTNQTERVFKAAAYMQVAGKSVKLDSADALKKQITANFGELSGSAERSLFGVGFIQRLTRDVSASQLMDMTAWTPTKPDYYSSDYKLVQKRKEAMQACIVLSRNQVEAYISALEKVVNNFDPDIVEESVQDTSALISDVIGVTAQNMSDPQNDAILNAEAFDQAVLKLKKELPYSTVLINEYDPANESTQSGVSLTNKVARIKQTLEFMRRSNNAASLGSVSEANADDGLFWILSNTGKRADDVLIIRIDWLP